jgi:hypothetical protein
MFEDFDYKYPDKEIFLDFIMLPRKTFVFYIIDHKSKKMVPYEHKYCVGLYNALLSKCKEYDIGRIGIYGKGGYMTDIYNQLSYSQIYVFERIDIYQWRMSLDAKTRSITHPNYYFLLQSYELISEDNYKQILKK